MNITIGLNSNLGENLGPNFIITSDVGAVSPDSSTLSELLVGAIFDLDNSSTIVNVTSSGICSNTLTLNIFPSTTTTTTLAPTTTTTTTIVSVDFYWGIYSGSTVTEDVVTSLLTAGSGYVGDPTGKLYTFPTGYSYKYWCIPDLPNTGERVISRVTNMFDIDNILVYSATYNNYQLNPTPFTQSITYAKLLINGIEYRIYRTKTKTTTDITQYVYSF